MITTVRVRHEMLAWSVSTVHYDEHAVNVKLNLQSENDLPWGFTEHRSPQCTISLQSYLFP